MRSLSLRGRFTVADNARITDHEIFRYEANDLTRGWIVEAVYIWPATLRAPMTGGDGGYQLSSSIATDLIGSASFDGICDASDNRQIAWCQAGWTHRESAVTDFISNSRNPPAPCPYVVDPEHVVANGLWLNMYTTSDYSEGNDREWCYMVILKAKKMDPKETILHLIKNVAQDVVN